MRGWIAGALLGLGAAACGGQSAAPWGTVEAEPDDKAEYIYDQAALHTFELTVAPEDLAFLDADPAAEVYVRGALRFEGATYENVGVRYKGSIGAFEAPCTGQVPGSSRLPRRGKCSVKVSFHEYDPEGRFFGLRKLQFHAMNRDSSLLRERLGYALFRAAGVPAPRATHARLVINGQLQGVYALVEQIDGRFTRSRFSEGGEGNLYKEIWPLHDDPEAYLGALETNEDEHPDVSPFVDFAGALQAGGAPDPRFIQLDQTLALLAADRVMINDDGPLHFYCIPGGRGNNPSGQPGNHNYYWYQEAGRSHFWLIPWDLDYVFDTSGAVAAIPFDWREEQPCDCTRGLYPASCDPLFHYLASHGDGFEAAVDAFLEGPLAGAEDWVSTWAGQIDDAVKEAEGINGAIQYTSWQKGVDNLLDYVARSRKSRGAPL